MKAHGYDEPMTVQWRGLYHPEHSEGRGKRMMDAAHRALTEAGHPITVMDLAPRSGLVRPSPAFLRMLRSDGRFTIRKMPHKLISTCLRMSVAETVSLKATA